MEVGKYSWSPKRRSAASDFIYYTFTPLYGFVMVIGALAALASMVIIASRVEQPLAVWIIFFGYVGLFLLTMLLSFLGWKKYRGDYNAIKK